MKIFTVALLFGSALLGCSQSVESPYGFTLPEGDIAKGELLFRQYKCSACHFFEDFGANTFNDETSVKELEYPIVLGESSHSVSNYANLVTSIINPSHKIAQQAYPLKYVTRENGSSQMRVYNDVMTVSELIDIVTFLQSKYKLAPPQYTQYPRY